jgi:hypothetical protein
MVTALGTSTSFDFQRPMYRFDFLLGVLVSRTFDVLAIIRVPRTAVRRHARRYRDRYSFRWTRSSFAAPWVEVAYRHDNARKSDRNSRLKPQRGRHS